MYCINPALRYVFAAGCKFLPTSAQLNAKYDLYVDAATRNRIVGTTTVRGLTHTHTHTHTLLNEQSEALTPHHGNLDQSGPNSDSSIGINRSK